MLRQEWYSVAGQPSEQTRQCTKKRAANNPQRKQFVERAKKKLLKAQQILLNGRSFTIENNTYKNEMEEIKQETHMPHCTQKNKTKVE